ncbi:hypothetical protein PV04_06468 [Phialophora macrospora]|uniref:Uncharacterized protein n=1 Tax=Phialophora macrospora TaxID=1851006 RepID=A0A0D2CPV6_9EURO|nr:hypothetical protein PV04_06468 [Phialophora macrospora]
MSLDTNASPSSLKRPADITALPSDPVRLKRTQVEDDLSLLASDLRENRPLPVKVGSDQDTCTLPAAFPSELARSIMVLCDTETLKNFRLTTSMWDHAPGPIMFNQVTIVPHIYFMERFFYAFRTSKLRERVREILIDNRWAEQLVGAVQKSPEIGQRRPYEGSMFTLGESIEFYSSKTNYESDVYYYPSLESNLFATLFTLTSALEVVRTVRLYTFDEGGNVSVDTINEYPTLVLRDHIVASTVLVEF